MQVSVIHAERLLGRRERRRAGRKHPILAHVLVGQRFRCAERGPDHEVAAHVRIAHAGSGADIAASQPFALLRRRGSQHFPMLRLVPMRAVNLPVEVRWRREKDLREREAYGRIGSRRRLRQRYRSAARRSDKAVLRDASARDLEIARIRGQARRGGHIADGRAAAGNVPRVRVVGRGEDVLRLLRLPVLFVGQRIAFGVHQREHLNNVLVRVGDYGRRLAVARHAHALQRVLDKREQG